MISNKGSAIFLFLLFHDTFYAKLSHEEEHHRDHGDHHSEHGDEHAAHPNFSESEVNRENLVTKLLQVTRPEKHQNRDRIEILDLEYLLKNLDIYDCNSMEKQLCKACINQDAVFGWLNIHGKDRLTEEEYLHALYKITVVILKSYKKIGFVCRQFDIDALVDNEFDNSDELVSMYGTNEKILKSGLREIVNDIESALNIDFQKCVNYDEQMKQLGMNEKDITSDDLQHFFTLTFYNIITNNCSPYIIPDKSYFLENIFKKYGNTTHILMARFKKLLRKLKIGTSGKQLFSHHYQHTGGHQDYDNYQIHEEHHFKHHKRYFQDDHKYENHDDHASQNHENRNVEENDEKAHNEKHKHTLREHPFTEHENDHPSNEHHDRKNDFHYDREDKNSNWNYKYQDEHDSHHENDHQDSNGRDGSHDIHDHKEGHDEHRDHAEHSNHDGHDDHDGHGDHDEYRDYDEHGNHDGHDSHDEHGDHDEHDDHKDYGSHDSHKDYHDHNYHGEYEVDGKLASHDTHDHHDYHSNHDEQEHEDADEHDHNENHKGHSQDDHHKHPENKNHKDHKYQDSQDKHDDHGNHDHAHQEKHEQYEKDHEEHLHSKKKNLSKKEKEYGVTKKDPEKLTNVGGLLEKQDPIHPRNKRSISKFSKCYPYETLLKAFKIESTESISISQFYEICPALIQQIESETCKYDNTDGYEDEHLNHNHGETPAKEEKEDDWRPWTCALLATAFVSLGSLCGIFAAPFYKKPFFSYLLIYLICLAVSTLIGDAVLHLIPHSINIHGHSSEEGGSHDNHHEEKEESGMLGTDSFLWKFLLILGGIYMFFIFEILMHTFSTKHGHSHKIEEEEEDSSLDESSLPLTSTPIKKDDNGTYKEMDMTEETVIHYDPTNLSPTAPLSPASADHKCESENQCTKETEVPKNVEVRYNKNSDTISTSTDSFSESPKKYQPAIKSVVWMVLIGDAVHNFVDGIAIGVAFSEGFPAGLQGGISTSIAILCHELPHELGDFAVLITSGLSIKRALIMNFISSLTSFVGAVIGVSIGTKWEATPWIFALTAGLFIYIALVDMLPEVLNSSLVKKRPFLTFALQNAGLLTGFAIMFALAGWEEKLIALISAT